MPSWRLEARFLLKNLSKFIFPLEIDVTIVVKEGIYKKIAPNLKATRVPEKIEEGLFTSFFISIV